MLQIRRDKIVPHRRISSPRITLSEPKTDIELSTFNQMETNHGWQKYSKDGTFAKSIDTWFKLVIEVQGESITAFIDGEMVYHEDEVIHIPMGKIGFRNYGNEEGYVRFVRVDLI